MVKHKLQLDEVLKISPWKSYMHRIPWLLIGLVGGLLSAKIIKSYENTLEENLILAAFMPLIVYMSSAVGTQLENFEIRDMSQHSRINILKYFLKHLVVILMIGTTLGIILFFVGYFLDLGYRIALVIAISLFLAIISSILTGLLIPYFFKKEGTDPADASGPVATIIQDLLSILIYFAVASILL